MKRNKPTEQRYNLDFEKRKYILLLRPRVTRQFPSSCVLPVDHHGFSDAAILIDQYLPTGSVLQVGERVEKVTESLRGAHPF